MIARIRNRWGRLKRDASGFLWHSRWENRSKPLSALVRVRDGEDFLRPAVESILTLADEVVIVDNMSRDETPRIIADLVTTHPDKVRAFQYNHDVATVGEESAALYRQQPGSPRLAHHYTNWCMSLCRHPFVLKWDDDMIATNQLEVEIECFRQSDYLQFDFGGENISPDYKRVLEWRAGVEPRIIPSNTRFGMYDFGTIVNSDGDGEVWKYSGEAPSSWVPENLILRSDRALYAHLKYCKRNPGGNQSSGFREALERKLQTGDEVSEEFTELLKRYIPSNVR